MSSELATVRAEVKTWERSFKQDNGRDPTVDDIRKQPAVAQKYRLYKKLSKASAPPSTSTLRSNDPPSTPPHQTSSASKPPPKLLQSSRTAETTAPLASFNPFSPQKNGKGKQKEAIPFSLSKPSSNPFASPRRSKVQASQRLQSPDPFPPIQSTESTQPSSSTLSPINPPSAVSRARKRLRGEPVSPSPKKGKRRRVLSPGNLPIPKIYPPGTGVLSDNSESDNEEDKGSVDDAGSSFVDDSPMKPEANGKAFTLLFEDTLRPISSTDLFGALAMKTSRNKGPANSLLSMDDDVFSPNSKARKPVNKPTSKKVTSVMSQASSATKARSKLVQMTLPIGGETPERAGKHSPSQSRPSAKRVLSEKISEPPVHEPDSESPPDRLTLTSQLLPPSPNLKDSYNVPGKSKLKDKRSSKPIGRKKSKAQKNEDDSMGSEDGSSESNGHQSVKLVYHSRGIRATRPTEDHSEIEDPILIYTQHVQPRGKGRGSVKPRGTDDEEDDTLEERESDDAGLERTEGSLPNELHRVLVLESLKSKKNVNEEESIVKGLLSGRRVLHYNPNKGGEVWGAGEDERDELAGRDDGVINEGEDEWQGDPIPWEVGELSESHYHVEEI